MYIETIKLRDFRNYDRLELQPHPGINLLFGQNGSGKTNLLEAIHYCALGRSHRTPHDSEVVRKGSDMGACGVTVHRQDSRTEVTVKLTPGEQRKKQVFLDRKKAARLSDLMGRVQCVIFSPEDLLLVREGPAVRRRYLDMLCSQLSPAYFTALQQYQTALNERNALLRQSGKYDPLPQDMMEIYEQAMGRQCEILIPMRRRMSAQIAGLAGEKYQSIASRQAEPFTLDYRCCTDADTDLAPVLCQQWKQLRREDQLRGTTTFGVHREDLLLKLSGRDMKLFASQGQVRTAALSMKLCQLDLFRHESGEAPILLLDDVMSELDMTRRTALLQEISDVQTFVTCTDESDLDGCRDRRTYRVSLQPDFTAELTETGRGEEIAPAVEDEEPDFT